MIAVSFVSLEQTNSYLNAVLLKGLIRRNGISLVCDPENVNFPNISRSNKHSHQEIKKNFARPRKFICSSSIYKSVFNPGERIKQLIQALLPTIHQVNCASLNVWIFAVFIPSPGLCLLIFRPVEGEQEIIAAILLRPALHTTTQHYRDILLISIPQSQDQKFWEKLIYWNKNYQEQVLTTYLSWINSCSSLIHWFWRIFWSCDRHKTRNLLVSWLLYKNWKVYWAKILKRLHSNQNKLFWPVKPFINPVLKKSQDQNFWSCDISNFEAILNEITCEIILFS